MIHPCDGHTDVYTTGVRAYSTYSALSIYAICCRALKMHCFRDIRLNEKYRELETRVTQIQSHPMTLGDFEFELQ